MLKIDTTGLYSFHAYGRKPGTHYEENSSFAHFSKRAGKKTGYRNRLARKETSNNMKLFLTAVSGDKFPLGWNVDLDSEVPVALSNNDNGCYRRY